MANTTVFTELNGLRAGADNVFRKASAEKFEYSDGEQAEQKLLQILRNASDLGSSSSHLEAQITDWPTEYHLSSNRANLLRPLNLQGVKRVLELGCGCGAISRYLGEQAGMQIDSVEGSSLRASLAALRCRDLANVTVSAGNFNEMQFPADHYDLVLYVGVTEYAGRFSPADSDQSALQDLLALARRTLTADGTVLVAIENRTGLKYMMGASEDHYGMPYVGIDNYPLSTGIRTYTRAEWQAQIERSGFQAHRFVYPFPDYKVPTLLVDESCDQRSEELLKALARIHSRDYSAPFDLGLQEVRLWQAILQAGALGEFANSFMLLLGDDRDRIRALLGEEIIEFPAALKPAARTTASLAPALLNPDSSTNLREQMAALQLHAEQLQQRLDVMINSRGWSMLTKIRAAFGRSTNTK